MRQFEKSTEGTICITSAARIEHLRRDRQYRLTIPLDNAKSNVATIHTSPGYNKYHAYCSVINEPEYVLACRVEVPDSRLSLFNNDAASGQQPAEKIIRPALDFNIKKFLLNGPDARAPTDEIYQASGISPEDKLLRWHSNLALISMAL
jgi:hypothetical protein